MYEQQLLTEKDLPGGKCWQKDELERGRKFYGPPIEHGAYERIKARVTEVEEKKRIIATASASIAVQEVFHTELV